MPVLIIGKAEKKRIAELIAHAKAHPVPLDVIRAGAVNAGNVMRLEDRKPGFARPPSEHMIFPGNYRAAFSIEEQPPGLCSHLSISVFDRSERGQMPPLEAIDMIAKAFGVPSQADHIWAEEFDPGEYAVNLVSLINRKTP